jgi:hypothetical protein
MAKLWERCRRGWLPNRLPSYESLWNGTKLADFPEGASSSMAAKERPEVQAAKDQYHYDRRLRDDLPFPTAFNLWRTFVLPCGHELSFWMGHEGQCVPPRIQCPYWIGHRRDELRGLK